MVTRTTASATEPRAVMVLPCAAFDATLHFFEKTLGFRLESIHPADAPRVAEMTGYGLQVRLDVDCQGTPGALRIEVPPDSAWASRARTLTAPNGTHIDIVVRTARQPQRVSPFFEITHASTEGKAHAGRAGMLYRDLLPRRQDGALIASHIEVPEGGPVPDYVHHHDIDVQVICVIDGWVRVVYEDQGDPFVLQAGDCVLQPPLIRHRVLETSDGLQVLEVTSPASHPTYVDHELSLPTDTVDAQRRFSGQRFVRHVGRDVAWQESAVPGFEIRSTAIAEATDGAMGVGEWRATRAVDTGALSHEGDRLFLYVCEGAAALHSDTLGHHDLRSGTACMLPPGEEFRFVVGDDGARWWCVTLPAEPGVSSRSTGGSVT